jgi:hypothetical protein
MCSREESMKIYYLQSPNVETPQEESRSEIMVNTAMRGRAQNHSISSGVVVAFSSDGVLAVRACECLHRHSTFADACMAQNGLEPGKYTTILQ